jgi:hypothetical protein
MTSMASRPSSAATWQAVTAKNRNVPAVVTAMATRAPVIWWRSV